MTYPSPTRNSKGFSLLELAIILVVLGLVAGGGVALLSSIWEQQKRIETQEYMKEVRQAVLTYANAAGRLPGASVTSPYPMLPYLPLAVSRYDAWGRPLQYMIHPGLRVNQATSCSTAKSLIDGTVTVGTWTGPKVWDEDAGRELPALVVLASAGAKDADNQDYDPDPAIDLRSVFDEIAGRGNNYTGAPFLRNRPRPEFDDLVIYIGPTTLYDWLKCP